MAIHKKKMKQKYPLSLRKIYTSQLMVETLEPRRLLSVILPLQSQFEAPMVDETGFWVTIGDDTRPGRC